MHLEVRGQPQVLSSDKLSFSFAEDLPLVWNSLISLDQPVRELQGSYCLCLLSTGVASPPYHAQVFIWVLKSSCLQGTHFTDSCLPNSLIVHFILDSFLYSVHDSLYCMSDMIFLVSKFFSFWIFLYFGWHFLYVMINFLKNKFRFCLIRKSYNSYLNIFDWQFQDLSYHVPSEHLSNSPDS